VDFEFHPPPRHRGNSTRRAAGISPDSPPLPPLNSRPTPAGARGGSRAGAGRGRGGQGGAAAVPTAPAAVVAEGGRGEGRGEGSGGGTGTVGVAWRAPRPPAPPALPRRFQYILAYIITSQYIPQALLNTSCLISIHPIHPLLDLQNSRQYILQFFNTSLDTSWHDSSTSFNTSCHENNTSDTSFNTLEYILPFFNISDVLDDVFDVLTSNTSFDTSQYILLIF
jgi:hypothetical protein